MMRNKRRHAPYWRLAALVSILTAAFIATIGSGGGGGDGERGPPAEARVVSVTDRGVLETNSRITARDGGYSAVFGGNSVWLYGDTFLNTPNQDGYSLISNTWSYTPDLDASDGITNFEERVDSVSAPAEFFPLTTEEKEFNDLHKGEICMETPCNARWALWPGAMVVDSANNWAYIFYNKIYAEPGDFNFQTVGQSVAVWKDFGAVPERPLFNRVTGHPTLAFAASEPAFGSAAWVVDTTVYVYGCDITNLVKPCRLARVPIAEVLNLAAWEYYAGNGNWSSRLNDATPVFNGNDIMSVFYSDYLQCYVAVYSQPIDTKTMLRTAPSPEGPWSRAIKLFDAQAPINNGWVYDALVHPEYTSLNGRTIYVTYSRMTALFTSEVRLVAVEIETTAAGNQPP